MGIRFKKCTGCNVAIHYFFMFIRFAIIPAACYFIIPLLVSYIFVTFTLPVMNATEYKTWAKQANWVNFILNWVLWVPSVIVACFIGFMLMTNMVFYIWYSCKYKHLVGASYFNRKKLCRHFMEYLTGNRRRIEINNTYTES